MVAVGNLAEHLIERIQTEEFVQVPASEEEYLAIAPEFPGKLEYHHGEIIAMSLATVFHELIVVNLGRLLANYFFDKDFLVTSSNAGLQIARPGGGYISVYQRTDDPNTWLNTDYKTLDSGARLGDLNLSISEVYHKINFNE